MIESDGTILSESEIHPSEFPVSIPARFAPKLPAIAKLKRLSLREMSLPTGRGVQRIRN
jgi:hypothetical protein